MSTNSRIQVSELDFNQIRANLITFLSGQSTFSDYKFDGSALSTLVDVLAYNTHYNALYTNLAINEMFLDSASKRSSLVSLANNFGYLPQSAKSSHAVIDVTVGPPVSPATQTLTLPKLSPFNATIDGESYTFYTIDDHTATVSYTSMGLPYYKFVGVNVYEGTPRSITYVCTVEDEKFVIPYDDIDLSTLKVNVQATGEIADYSTYAHASTVLTLDDTSEIYYIKELENGTYSLSFGSSNLGKPIDIGNVITLTGLTTSKSLGNGAIALTHGGITMPGSISVAVTTPSFGGEDKETSDEIRANVSQFFFDQNRAVTPSDFVSIIKRYWTDIDSIAVWGGENNDPIVFGKVFIAIKPASKLYLTTSEENTIRETILRPRTTTSLTMEFVKPSYIDIEVNSTVYYNKQKTSRSADDIKNSVRNAITNYNNRELKRFDGVFRMSKFSAMIDAVDTSIQSNITTIKLYLAVDPKYNTSSEYKINIVNPIYHSGVAEEAFLSTGFYIDDTSDIYYLTDDGIGNIILYKNVAGVTSKVLSNAIGTSTVDYAAGKVTITGLRILRLDDPNFRFIIKTASNDVVSVRNQIVNIPNSRVTVNLIEDAISAGVSTGGTNHIFTTSRN